MTALFKMPKRASVPRDEGLDEIRAWHAWFVGAHEERLRDFPDTHLLEQERAKVAALAVATVERMKTDYLARTR